MTVDTRPSIAQPEQHWSDTLRFARGLRRGEEYALLQLTPTQMAAFVTDVITDKAGAFSIDNLGDVLPDLSPELTVRFADTFASLLAKQTASTEDDNHLFTDGEIEPIANLTFLITSLNSEIAAPIIRPILVPLTDNWQCDSAKVMTDTDANLITCFLWSRYNMDDPVEDAPFWKKVWENSSNDPRLWRLASMGLKKTDPAEYVRQLPEVLRRIDMGCENSAFSQPWGDRLVVLPDADTLTSLENDHILPTEVMARFKSLARGEPLWLEPFRKSVEGGNSVEQIFLTLSPRQLRQYIKDRVLGNGPYSLPEGSGFKNHIIRGGTLHYELGKSRELDQRTAAIVGATLQEYVQQLRRESLDEENNRAVFSLAKIVVDLPRDIALADSLLKPAVDFLSENWQLVYELAIRECAKRATFPGSLQGRHISYPPYDFRDIVRVKSDLLRTNPLQETGDSEKEWQMFDTETMLWLAKLHLQSDMAEFDWQQLWKDGNTHKTGRWTVGFLSMVNLDPQSALQQVPEALARTALTRDRSIGFRWDFSFALNFLLPVLKDKDRDRVIQQSLSFSELIEGLSKLHIPLDEELIRSFQGRKLREFHKAVSHLLESKREFLAKRSVSANAAAVFKEIWDEQIRNLFVSPNTVREAEIYASLLSYGIHPTERIRKFMDEHPEDGLKQLTQLATEVENGQLNPENPLFEIQKDLVFPAFVGLAIDLGWREAMYQRFQRLEFKRIEETLEPWWQILRTEEVAKAEKGAQEVAKLYWQIYQFAERGQKVRVVGNDRNGTLWGTEIIGYELQKEGILVSGYHVGTNASKHEAELTLKSLEALLRETQPDVVFVIDATPNAREGDTPRLPRALKHYYDWFQRRMADSRLNYGTAYWVPDSRDKVIFGDKLVDYAPPRLGERQVVYAGITGYFDDPERYAKSEIDFILSQRGVEKLTRGGTTEQIIGAVQDYMIEVLPSKLEEESPDRF